ncbi:MAG: hypothetical protein KBG15_14090 [Kofleriaceae bacterium]|nr:hypothetical protein [Kofleriaceae bacterium]
MRILSVVKSAFLAATLTMAAVGCGPSYQEMKLAKDATYNITGKELFDIALQVTQRNFKVEAVGDTRDWLATTAKWYTPEGQSVTGGARDYVKATEGSINVSLRVQVVSDGTHSRVIVKAVARRFKVGMSALEEFNDEDTSKPGWVNGKADTLAYEIWEAAKKYQTTTAPGATAPIVPAPVAPAPAAPAPVAPAPVAPAPDVPVAAPAPQPVTP